MTRPAVRVGDSDQCPLKQPQPHELATVTVGAPSVLIEGMPAAHVGSAVVCAGAPAQNAIAAGSASVLVCEMKAARTGDKTAHGGVIIATQGTVLIGG
jgi:uncharacterized Zn-binding protein involved in type VI secretion